MGRLVSPRGDQVRPASLLVETSAWRRGSPASQAPGRTMAVSMSPSAMSAVSGQPMGASGGVRATTSQGPVRSDSRRRATAGCRSRSSAATAVRPASAQPPPGSGVGAPLGRKRSATVPSSDQASSSPRRYSRRPAGMSAAVICSTQAYRVPPSAYRTAGTWRWRPVGSSEMVSTADQVRPPSAERRPRMTEASSISARGQLYQATWSTPSRAATVQSWRKA